MSDLRLSLSPHDYVDPEVYALEVEHVLRTSWLPVCRADQIPDAGDRRAVSLAGHPVVAVRSGEGEIRLLANVCPHRGSTVVAEDQPSSSTIICPYHRWAFRLDGSLIGAPLAGEADLDGACLRPLRHAIWEGFVLVNLSGDAPSPDCELASLSAEIAPWRWSELVTVASMTFESSWNWKVMVENWIECYHHLGTHRETVEVFQPAHTTTVVPSGADPWVAMTVESIEGVAGAPSAWIPGLPPERARDLVVWSAFPLLLGGCMARYAFWLHVAPLDAVSHRVTWNLLAHPDRLELFTDEAIAHELETLGTVHAEDMETCARVQAGLASGLLDRFRLTPLEAPIADFQRWIASRLGR